MKSPYMKLKIIVAVFTVLTFTQSTYAQFATMREAIVIGAWFDKFDIVHAECQGIQKKEPQLQPDIARHFQNMKAACSSSRYGQNPIPEDIQVDNYKIIKSGRDCAVLLPAELVKGSEERLRIDGIVSLREDEKQTLRKRLGEPIADLLQRCQSPLNQFDLIRKSARKANGKGAFD
jgi:hypothetical protein